MTEKLFDRLMKDKFYRELIEKLPEDERFVVIKTLKNITEKFETNIYEPLKNRVGK